MSSGFVSALAFAIICAHICVVFASPAALKNSKDCEANEERVLCGKWCGLTCRHPEERMCGVNPALCTYDCRCKEGFVRNDKTKECIRFGDCPKDLLKH